MSIKSDVAELESIRLELKRLSEKRKQFKLREKAIENKISEYLKSKDQIGLKNNGIAIVLEEKETREKIKNKEKDEQAIDILNKLGIKDSEKVLEALMEARKGAKTTVEKLTVKKYKPKG